MRSKAKVVMPIAGAVLLFGASPTAHADPDPTFTNTLATVSAKHHGITPGTQKAGEAGAAPPPSTRPSERALPASIAPKPKVKNAPRKDKIEVKTDSCTNMGLSQCSNARTACSTASGNPNYFPPPTITWVSVNDGPWQYSGLSCGVPESVTVPSAPGEPDQPAQTVAVEPPPVPSFGQIQEAFRDLPFSKPSVKIQPKGQRTAKNLKTFYAATWPSDSGLQPGEVSKPVKLLSWSVEFKVAAQDYRYNFGDGEHSGWTTSTGGTYPDGDVTHTYPETGDVEVDVDARLTGQYRVNGGEWQDIATVADLQDEPSFTLEVLGTKTGLVHH